jgi:hypothetical protein
MIRKLRRLVLCVAMHVTPLMLGSALPMQPAHAAAPTCHTYSGSGYCQYTGVVQQAYVNSAGLIIIFFDTPFDLSAPASVGIPGVSVSNACAFVIAESPDYAKMLYASALTAQARGTTVSMQLWGTTQGYLRCDRILVNS